MREFFPQSGQKKNEGLIFAPQCGHALSEEPVSSVGYRPAKISLYCLLSDQAFDSFARATGTG
jgi:hypothetical protein